MTHAYPQSDQCNDATDSHQPACFPAQTQPTRGLYVHIPFCFHKCHYCDFYSLVETPQQDRQPTFVDALIRQLNHLAPDSPAREAHGLQSMGVPPGSPAPGTLTSGGGRTIFVGGGTPTLLAPALWERLLGAMRDQGWLENIEEFTVEANPETVTDELASVLAAGGVNRVSIGAQSFNLDLLKQLERWHDPANVSRAMDCFRRVGITNLNLDLIFAIPTQTLAQVDEDLDRVIALDPAHVSYYSLIFESNTPLTKKLQLGRVSSVGEDLERAMFERVIERLAQAGYEHYEISNWSKPNKPCKHNLLYWRNENWFAVGPSASGHQNGRRWKIEPKLGPYIKQSPTPAYIDEEYLSPRQRTGEQLMMTLRLREGITLDWLNTHLEKNDARHDEINTFIERGLLERTATHLRLTHEGLFLADTVMARLL